MTRGRRLIDMTGTIDMDWSRIEEEMAARTDPNATIEGEPLAFRVAGALDGPMAELAGRLDGEIQASVTSADVFGMKLGRVPVRVRSNRGEISIDPIETTLNDGRLRVVPEIVGDPASGVMSVRLDHRTTLETASVNDEVSRRVLSFVVPTLADATRVHGVVSLAIDRAELPILGDGTTMAEGQMVFRDVEFLPGPLANQLLAVVGGNGDRPVLRLDQPVVLSISDGAVRQRGLSIPLGNVASIDMEGSVTFDKELDLRVSVPLAPQGLTGDAPPIVAAIVGGVRPMIPIGGTLDEPKVNMEEFGRGMGRMGLDIAGRAGLGGLDALIQRMSAPPDPEEQARREAEAERRRIEAERRKAEAARKKAERKAREELKRRERRARRGL
jgi:translocation and assembly module TamB